MESSKIEVFLYNGIGEEPTAQQLTVILVALSVWLKTF